MSINILNLPGWEIIRVEEDRSSYRIYARYEMAPAHCPRCGVVEPKTHRFGKRENVFADLPHHGKRAEIVVERQRYRCQECGAAFLEPLPHIDEKHHATKRLVVWIEQQSLRRPFAQVAQQVEMGESTVRRIFIDFSERLLADHRPRAADWMGIDEIHLMGKPRAVITKLKTRSVIDMLEDRDKNLITQYFLRLPGRERTEVVAMDQWRPYRDAVRVAMPQAAVVVDKFHILAAATQGLEGVRKAVRKGLKTSRQRVQLKNDRFLLLKNADKLKPNERLIIEAWGAAYPDLVLAWELKEEYYAIYGASTKEEARDRMRAWLPKVPKHFYTKEKFKKAVDAFRNWEDEILAYWDYPATNAYTESLNNQIRSIARQGRGYPRFDLLRTKVIFTPPGWAEKRLREKLPEGMPEAMRFLPEGWRAIQIAGEWFAVPKGAVLDVDLNDPFAMGA